MNNFYKYPYYRNILPPPPIAQQKPFYHPPSKPSGPKKPPPKKITLKTLKKDTCKSLNDVEHFLCNFSDFVRYARLINLLK